MKVATIYTECRRLPKPLKEYSPDVPVRTRRSGTVRCFIRTGPACKDQPESLRGEGTSPEATTAIEPEAKLTLKFAALRNACQESGRARRVGRTLVDVTPIYCLNDSERIGKDAWVLSP